MANARTKGIMLLSSTTGVDMKTAASTTLYTIPTGNTGFIAFVVVRNNSASLAGGTSYSFTSWRQTVDLSAQTTASTKYYMLDANNASYTALTAGTNFQITVTTGSTAACTATIEVFGYLV